MTTTPPTLRQPVRHCGRSMEAAEIVETAEGTIALVTVAAPERVDANEDAIAVVPEAEGGSVIVVADGVGGAPLGGKASELAIEAMIGALGEPGGAVRDRVLDGFERANAAILALGVGAATTLIAAEIKAGTLRCYHAGDSAALVTGGRGRVKLLTMAHSPVGYGIEAGLIDPQDAMNHDQRHMVSNLVGNADMRVEIGSPTKLSPLDTVIIGTDGLFDNLLVEEIVSVARKGPLAEAANSLRAACRARMTEPVEGKPSKPDDLTFAVFRQRGPVSEPPAADR